MIGSLWAYFAYWANEERKYYRLINPFGVGKDAEF